MEGKDDSISYTGRETFCSMIVAQGTCPVSSPLTCGRNTEEWF